MVLGLGGVNIGISINKKCQSSSYVLLYRYSIYWVFTDKEIPKFWVQKMSPCHCRNWYCVPKAPIRYYLWGLGTLCVPNHLDYTCSCLMWFGLYGKNFMNYYVAFPKARNHLKAKNLWTDSPNPHCVLGLHHGIFNAAT